MKVMDDLQKIEVDKLLQEKILFPDAFVNRARPWSTFQSMTRFEINHELEKSKKWIIVTLLRENYNAIFFLWNHIWLQKKSFFFNMLKLSF